VRANLFFTLIAASFLTACGSLERKSIMLNVGDSKEQVLSVMGTPDDRQLQGENEAWQYCQTGAGFGYHDYRTIWFFRGKVTGINSYKSSRPGSLLPGEKAAAR
jgi:hypothetical protein